MKCGACGGTGEVLDPSESIKEAVAAWFVLIEAEHGITAEQMQRKDRRKAVCAARHHLCWGLRSTLGLPHKQIMPLAGLTHHASVIDAVQSHLKRSRA